MPADVLEKPAIDNKTFLHDTKPVPRWLIILLQDDKKDVEVVRSILNQVMKHLGQIRIEQIMRELTAKRMSIVFRGTKEQAEKYYDQLKENELAVQLEPEC